MSAAHDSTDTLNTNTAKSDILVPKYTNGDVIKWEGNNAHIEGVLYEVKQYCLRKKLFQPLLEHNAVLLSNGKLAVDSIQAYNFISGVAQDPRDFDDPCPPTARRIAQYDARMTAAGSKTFTNIATMPPGFSDGFVISKYAVEAEDARLHDLLSNVISWRL